MICMSRAGGGAMAGGIAGFVSVVGLCLAVTQRRCFLKLEFHLFLIVLSDLPGNI